MRVAFLTWRDTGHPDGGGSEVYVEKVAAVLARRGHDVTLVTARYPGSRAREVHRGVRVRRAGGRLSVYPRGLLWLLSRDGRRQDVVVDVVNGLPFAARLVRRRGLLALVHHVHRQQWRIIYPGAAGRVGWFVESVLTPRLYRSVHHVTVSDASRSDLVALGISAHLVRVVRNGIDPQPADPIPGAQRSSTARLCVLSRLVPHKQIEHALEVLAALRREDTDLELDVIGDGWWRDRLVRRATELGVAGATTFHGHVDESEKRRLLAHAWVALLPSVKEGWGLVVLEAAAAGTPTVAYRSAGGVTESVVDGETGVLVDDLHGMGATVRRLVRDPDERARLGAEARARAARFDWEATGVEFENALRATVSGRRS